VRGYSKKLRGRHFGFGKGDHPSTATKKRISETTKRNPDMGGYRRGSGRSRGQGYESPISGKLYLDSSYELRYAKWLDKHGIKWEKNQDRFLYVSRKIAILYSGFLFGG